ncbi:retrovirus-related pol polyprotein from transposon TNT 1-94 [Tanacetum coccineum]|uniref:Retrovirus-related pol polyprotein from transposon TNT 1-94 n=1 Tax=Tanacetum coccineum TaxID=301880 RepID=A0ABQ5B676_9ASTR
MTGAKFDIEKFDGTGDFRLWRIKMRALLIQHGCEAALEVLSADMEAEAKAELNKKAHSACELNASVEEKDSLAQGDRVSSILCDCVLESHKHRVSSVRRHTTQGSGGYGFIFSGSNTKHLESSKSEQIIKKSDWETVKKHLTVAGRSQQNGVAERMNGTLMDKVRCLLIQSGLPKTFWAGKRHYAAYLINRSPLTAIEKKTPMEMWSGHPSDYGMLRIFGCVTHSRVKQDTLKDSGGRSKDQKMAIDDEQGIMKLDQTPDLTNISWLGIEGSEGKNETF